MATLHRHIVLDAPRATVWEAVRDLGNLPRLVPGFVKESHMDGADARVVVFANGLRVREVILSLDDARFRLAWNAEGARTTHYNAVLQLFEEEGGKTRAVWTTDLLPHDLAGPIGAMHDQGLAAMQRAFAPR